MYTDKTAVGDRSLWCVLTPRTERFLIHGKCDWFEFHSKTRHCFCPCLTTYLINNNNDVSIVFDVIHETMKHYKIIRS